MKTKAQRKDFCIEIRKTKGRFISIFFIVALGVAFFTGIRSTEPDMKLSADLTYDKSNLMDIKILSTLGLVKEDIDAFRKVTGVNEVYGAYSTDALVVENEEHFVVKILSYPNTINKPTIKEGRKPETTRECFVDTVFLMSTGHKIGDKIQLKSGTNKDLSDTLKYEEYIIVGSGTTSYYLTKDKGTSTIGSGKINSFIMILEDAFTLEAFTEVYITGKGTKELISYSVAYQDIVDKVMDNIENTVKNDRIEARYLEITTKAKNEINKAKVELTEAEYKTSKELEEAKNKLNKAKEEIESGQIEINKKEEEIEDGLIQFESFKEKLEEGKAELATTKKQLGTWELALSNGKNEYLKGLEEYKTGMNDLGHGRAQVKQIEEQLANISDPVERALIQGAIEQQKTELANAEVLLSNTKETLDETKNKLNREDQSIKTGKIKYDQSMNALDNESSKLLIVSNKLQNGKNQLLKAKQELKEGEKEYKKGLIEYQDGKEKADKKLEDARIEITNAESEINKIKKPKWYILDRNSIPSYVGFGQDADRIRAIGKVFPVIFFLVAALVSLTTMTRMVEEQRTQIGTLKALGYSKLSIASKYIIYALLATIGGSVLGGIIGSYLLPYVIISAYQIMYENLEIIAMPLNGMILTLATLISVICIVMATFLSCYKELEASPAKLMRPAAPKIGKRVFMERIPFVWKHLNFTSKATIRNLIRYKKRFFMTIFGISACMSLLLVGFGIKDSIFSIANIQYGEIRIYDGILSFDSDIDENEREEMKNYIDSHKLVKESILIQESAITAKSNNISKDAYLTVIENEITIGNYYQFRDRISHKPYIVTNDGVIITEKLSKLLKVSVGDTLSLKYDNFDKVNVTVLGIVENYVMHYIFMTPILYEQLFNELPKYNQILYLAPDIKPNMEEDFSKEVLSSDYVVNNTFTRNISNEFSDSLDNLDIVILVLIFAAGGLAFVVLYNLNNINISERKRELATLKVLGFYDLEVSEYVFRENILLTIIGTLTGIILGIILHQYVINTVEIEMIMFGRKILFFSYIKSILLTFLFSIVINFSMHFKLKKVDMATSLKSVE